jgi:hypothetical protein
MAVQSTDRKKALEPRDYYLLALLISGFALLASVAAAGFLYRQYRLNLARDRRELQRERDERIPWITILANKLDNQPHSWLLYCTFQNRNYRPAEIKRISLLAPQSSQLADTVLADVGAIQRYRPVMPFGRTVTLDNVCLDIAESRELVLLLIIGDAEALQASSRVQLRVRIAFRDNEDSSVDVDRTAQLI